MQRLPWLRRPVQGLRVVAVMALATAACMGGGTRPRTPPAAPPAPAELQGEWELVSIEAQGQPLRGSGHLSFDAFNNIAVHAELAPGEAGSTPPRLVVLDFSAKATADGGRLAYVGLERREPADRMVPTASEPQDWRFYAIEGDALTMWREAEGARAGVLTFRRVR